MLSRPIVKAISGERVGMVQVFSFFPPCNIWNVKKEWTLLDMLGVK